MAYTESKAYDLRNVQYQGTRIGGIDQITTPPIQYQGTPVTYVKHHSFNIMHRYTVRNGDDYSGSYDEEWDFSEQILAGKYSVSSTSKNKCINTDIPVSDSNFWKIQYQYYITKYELTRTSGTKNENKYYLYAFTIALRKYYRDKDDFIHPFTYRTDKYDYLSTDDLSLDMLAAQIEDPSGSDEGFTPPWKLGISTERILKKTRRERERTDDIFIEGNFINFSNYYDDPVKGKPSSWDPEPYCEHCEGMFNQAVEGLKVYFYQYSPSNRCFENGIGNIFNFGIVVNSISQVDSDHVFIDEPSYTNDHSSCALDQVIDGRRDVYITDSNGDSISSDDFEHFSLIFLICSSCSNSALSNGDDKVELRYYNEDYTLIKANLTYKNYIAGRDY